MTPIKNFYLLLIAVLLAACGSGVVSNVADVLDDVGEVAEDVTGIDEIEDELGKRLPEDVDADVALGLGVELLDTVTISVNSNGELALDVSVPLAVLGRGTEVATSYAAIANKRNAVGSWIGSIGDLAELNATASLVLSKKNTLVIVHNGFATTYDLEGRPIRVKLNNVDAIVEGDGKGNVIVFVEDSSVDSQEIRQRQVPVGKPKLSTAETLTAQEIPIGTSADGNPITAYRLGNGRKNVVLIGGMHAGFAPGSTDLVNRLQAHFAQNGILVPDNVSITFIPVANPDSQSGGADALSGRLNGNGVDLNRNWGCNWQAEGQWRSMTVSGGPASFSEPETEALADFLLTNRPEAVIVWGAKGNMVIPGSCDSRTSSPSQSLASAFGNVSGYRFGYITYYTISGDITDWLDSQGIPAVYVLLSDYRASDFERNLDAVKSLLFDISRE